MNQLYKPEMPVMTKKSKLIPIVLITVSLFTGAACRAETAKAASKFAKADSGALAVIAGKTITPEIFKAEMARRKGEFNTERKEELLDSMVRSEVLFAAAKAAGYEKDPEVIAAIKQVLVGKYLRDNLDPKLAQIKATDQEAESYYQSHQAEFGTPAMVHAAMIKIAVSPKYSSEKKTELLTRAENARTEALALEAGVPAFGGVAVKYSEDQNSRYRGGDIDWLQAGAVDGRVDKKVSDALFALKVPGEISPVIAEDDGFYIVKLMEVKGATVRPFEAVKDGVRYHVVQDKKKKIEKDFIEQLKNRIPVTVNSGLLQTITPPPAAIKAGPPALPAR